MGMMRYAGYLRRVLPSISSRVKFVPRQIHSSAFRYQDQTSLSSPTHDQTHPQKQSLGKIEPRYQIQFTCNVCDHRNMHEFSKYAYHNTVVIYVDVEIVTVTT